MVRQEIGFMKLTRFLALSLGAVALLGLTGCSSKKGSGASAGSESDFGEYGSGASASGGIGLGTLERVQFEFDSSNLTQSARDTLQSNARTILANSKMRVLVEGHCDERGSNEYNLALGERRSKSVIDYLVNLGVPRSRLEAKSWGEERPLNPASTSGAYRVNRRAEFVILAK